MRIIGGIYGGRKLKEFEKIGVRPTSDMLRESLFNIIGEKIDGAVFLDLFGGTGAVGIEALSRGAKRVVFNDSSKNSLKLIEENLKQLGAREDYKIIGADYQSLIENTSEKFDYIFIDPPYKSNLGESAVSLCEKILNTNGTIILEDERDENFNFSELALINKRRYGRAFLYFFKRKRSACVFAGTFDPITCGHEEIISKCLNLYKKVIIVIGENDAKTPYFTLKERKMLVETMYKDNPNIEIIVYSEHKDKYYELLKERKAFFYVRGIRDSVDEAYERSSAEKNALIYPEITTEFIKADKKFKKVSSSFIRQRIFDGQDVSLYVPEKIKLVIKELIANKKQA